MSKKTIYLDDAIDAIEKTYGSIAYQEDGFTRSDAIDILKSLPSAQPEIIKCKDCRKHNISPRRDPENCCPLYHYRGMSFGSEHDLQFCSYGKRKTDGDK